MDADLRERLRFYQELGIDSLYRRQYAGQPHAATAAPAAEESVAPSGQSGFASPPRQTSAGDAPAERERLVETLADIQADLEGCLRCKLSKGRHTIVFGSGNPQAGAVFVGEGPGADEDEQGLPFVGRAGQMLTEMINKSAERMGVPLRREDVYICNVVKCRPPGNRTPERDEIETCSPFLMRQIEAIRPRAIVALGSTAVRALLKSQEPMSKLRGRWFDFLGAKLLVTFHPAYLLRDPSRKRDAWQDMQMLLRFLYNLS